MTPKYVRDKEYYDYVKGYLKFYIDEVISLVEEDVYIVTLSSVKNIILEKYCDIPNVPKSKARATMKRNFNNYIEDFGLTEKLTQTLHSHRLMKLFLRYEALLRFIGRSKMSSTTIQAFDKDLYNAFSFTNILPKDELIKSKWELFKYLHKDRQITKLVCTNSSYKRLVDSQLKLYQERFSDHPFYVKHFKEVERVEEVKVKSFSKYIKKSRGLHVYT